MTPENCLAATGPTEMPLFVVIAFGIALVGAILVALSRQPRSGIVVLAVLVLGALVVVGSPVGSAHAQMGSANQHCPPDATQPPAPPTTPPIEITEADLTPQIVMPSASFAPDQTNAFAIAVVEILGFATAAGTIELEVTAPVGWELEPYDSTLVTITPAGGSSVATVNANFDVVAQSASTIRLRMKPGVFVPANGFFRVGMHTTRTTALAGETPVLTITILNDADSSNNVFTRILTAT